MCPGCFGLCCLVGLLALVAFKVGRQLTLPLGLLVGLLFAGSALQAQEIQSTPNKPVAYGDQLWVVRDGKVVERYTDQTFKNGHIININGVNIGSTFGCPPRQQEPPQFSPPPFEAPKPEVPELPAVPPVDVAPVDSGPNLLQIALFVSALVGGYYVGRKAASDDKDEDEPADVPAAV